MPDLIPSDLYRCPHGRKFGDACAGWRGPGDLDGGCRGGYSLGNPYPTTDDPDRIGTTIFGDPIRSGDLPPAVAREYGAVLRWDRPDADPIADINQAIDHGMDAAPLPPEGT